MHFLRHKRMQNTVHERKSCETYKMRHRQRRSVNRIIRMSRQVYYVRR